MDAETAVVLAAAVGGIAGVGGAVVAGYMQRHNAKAEWIRDRDDELWREERRCLLALTELLAQAAHEADWMTWAAQCKPLASLRADMTAYEITMKALLPKVTAAQAAAAGVSDGVYERFDPLVHGVLALDVSIAELGVYLADDATAEQAQARLKDLNETSDNVSREIVREVSSYLRLEHARATPGVAVRQARKPHRREQGESK